MEKFIQVLALPHTPAKYRPSLCILVSLQPQATSVATLPMTPVSSVANYRSPHLLRWAFARPPLI